MDPFPEGPKGHPQTPDVEHLSPRRVCSLVGWLLLAFTLTLAASFLLPDDRYIRFQQARGTVMFHAKWIYERVACDSTPIDVAAIGASRLEASVSPSILENELLQITHQHVQAVNLSLVRPGRDLTYEIVKLLLEYHPEVKVVLLSADGDATFSQPLFKAIASVQDVAAAPLLFNVKYAENLLYLPYRNLNDFIRSQLPYIFGVSNKCPAEDYLGFNLDRTFGYIGPEGEIVNGDQAASEASLAKQADLVVGHREVGMAPYLRRLPPDLAQPGERYYVRQIVQLLENRGVKVMFINTPIYGSHQVPVDLAFYTAFGRTVSLDDLVAHHPEFYANGAHLNRHGAVTASKFLAALIAPLLSEGTSAR